MMKYILILVNTLLIGLTPTIHAAENSASIVTTDTSQSLLLVQQQWAKINYELTGDEKTDAFISLLESIKTLQNDNPNHAELLIWTGIIQSSTAGAKGGIGALKYAKKARKNFEQALRINETALNGSALTSLGVLYHKVPAWPISFGSDKKAEKLLTKALEINPNGIDPNYFYAEFLFDNHQYQQAMTYIANAKAAPARPNRPVADKGRRAEIMALEAKILAKL